MLQISGGTAFLALYTVKNYSATCTVYILVTIFKLETFKTIFEFCADFQGKKVEVW
jgi:hypothetical protein